MRLVRGSLEDRRTAISFGKRKQDCAAGNASQEPRVEQEKKG